MSEERLEFATRQVHAGKELGGHDPRATPIYLTAGFVFDDFDEARDRFAGGDGYSYTRVGNPTSSAVERRIADLEGGIGSIFLGSGQAAVSVALLALAHAGDEIVAAESLYEGTRGLLTENLAALGISSRFVVDHNDADAWEAAITPRTRAVLVESIPNPRNDLVDIALVAEVAHRHGVPLVVDNTFATPYLLRPIEHGADIVVHSASKFLAGHGAVIGGAVVDSGAFDWTASGRFEHLTTPRQSLGERSLTDLHGPAAFLVHARDGIAMRFGPTPSPFTAFLVAQGIETLSLRVDRQSANALAIAEFLASRPEVESVDYSGLASSPYRALADRYLPLGQGSVFSFTLRGGETAARAFYDAVELFTRMTHLGDVRSLVLHPRTTSHTHRSETELEATGVGHGMLRLSVGIEDVRDLVRDLDRALEAARLATLESAVRS